ncbi:hypothetical protein C4D60_Mb00t02330 [Musa balbisiana]|uniref:Uncharacterized protein n=1 Tax=Musa balbisiana TaxID=52838 RepID=A0A4S8I7C9_MUSBA|nr:hypothetical protein C4D60_Mb00t02330 [Musa balbisiana]
MTYVVLKGYPYEKFFSDRLRKARGSNGTGEMIPVRIILVLVSDPGSVSPFFRDGTLHQSYICLVDR